MARLAAAALLLLGTALAGCGSSPSPPPPNPVTARATATAYADRVNLAASDLPQARRERRSSQGPFAPGASATFANCVGAVSPSVRIVDFQSPTFALGEGSLATRVRSSVQVLPSAALAARKFTLDAGVRAQGCLVKLLRGGVAVKSAVRVSLQRPLLAHLHTPPPAAKLAGLRVSGTVVARFRPGRPAERLPRYIAVYDILAGRADVILTVAGAAPSASSEAQSTRLLELLYRRAQQEPL